MGKHKNKYGDWNAHYWQSADLNRRTVQMYRDWILSLAMLRYRWEGLPDTCDARYLEWCLVTQGVATIARPKDGGLDAWVSTQATSGAPNIYDNPTSWESVGNNGWRFDVTPSNGVLVWDNTLRYPIWNQIDLWANRLAEFDRVLDINLQQQKVPWIATAPYERQTDLVNTVKQAFGGEPAILGLRGMEEIKVDLLMTPVDFKGEDLQESKKRVWNDIYTYLGISNLERKGERMITSEVQSMEEPNMIRRMDGLMTRRHACEMLNDRFGLDVHVYWNKDNESDNYNTIENIRNFADLGNENLGQDFRIRMEEGDSDDV